MTQPPVAPTASARPAPDAAPDWARTIGGLLFGAGALVLFIRKSAEPDPWGDFALLLVLLVPCAALLATAAREHVAGAAPRPWQTVHLVFGVVLVPLVLAQLVETLGGTPDTSLNVAWIFLVTAAIALGSSLRFGALYQALLGGLALIVSWTAVWNEILDDPSTDTRRWLFLVVGALLVAAAAALLRLGRAQGSELITAAGVAALIAGAIGAAQTLVEIATQGLFGIGGEGGTGAGWDLFLLVVSLALIAYGARARVRGPAYVGAAGLVAFVFSVGSEIAALAEGEEGDHQFFGWPAILLVLGIAAFVAGTAMARDSAAPRAPERDPLLDQWGGQPPSA
jgi:hypothetical protein